MPCKDCIHKGVCRYKEEYEIFLNKELKDAFDIMPQICDMHVDCKAYMPAEEIAQCDLKEISFKASYKTFYNYDWHNVEIYIYPKCESVFEEVSK